MVWWIDKVRTIYSRHTPHDSYNIRDDRLLQTLNVIFNCYKYYKLYFNCIIYILSAELVLKGGRENYTTDDIYSLLTSGVNIFNVDRSTHTKEFHNYLTKLIDEAIEMPEMYKPLYPRPVAVSVTMSVNDTIEIDDKTDIIIVKDVLQKSQFTDFKTRHSNFHGRFLFWFLINCNDDVNELIKISDGVVLECSNHSIDFTSEIFDTTKKAKKPLFCLNPGISQEVVSAHDGKRKFMAIASEIVDENVDGIFMNGTQNSTMVETEIVRTITEATQSFESRRRREEDYKILRTQFKEPQLSTMGVMIAASLAALKFGATAIILLTASGSSARLISRASPPCHVIAITARQSTARVMHLYRKVIPLFYNHARAINWLVECRNRVLFGTEFAEKSGLFGCGAKLVVLAPSSEGVGYCDGFQIVTTPFRTSVTGKVC